MNADINILIEIAKYLNIADTYSDLQFLKSRIEEPNKELILPLVGEFRGQ